MLEDGIARHFAFAREYGVLLEDSLGVWIVASLSDEAHFHFSGYINKHNA